MTCLSPKIQQHIHIIIHLFFFKKMRFLGRPLCINYHSDSVYRLTSTTQVERNPKVIIQKVVSDEEPTSVQTQSTTPAPSIVQPAESNLCQNSLTEVVCENEPMDIPESNQEEDLSVHSHLSTQVPATKVPAESSPPGNTAAKVSVQQPKLAIENLRTECTIKTRKAMDSSGMVNKILFFLYLSRFRKHLTFTPRETNQARKPPNHQVQVGASCTSSCFCARYSRLGRKRTSPPMPLSSQRDRTRKPRWRDSWFHGGDSLNKARLLQFLRFFYKSLRRSCGANVASSPTLNPVQPRPRQCQLITLPSNEAVPLLLCKVTTNDRRLRQQAWRNRSGAHRARPHRPLSLLEAMKIALAEKIHSEGHRALRRRISRTREHQKGSFCEHHQRRTHLQVEISPMTSRMKCSFSYATRTKGRQ